MSLALPHPRPRRSAGGPGGFLLPLFTLLLPLAGCSEILGGDGAAQVIEVALVNPEDGDYIIVRPHRASGPVYARLGENKPMEVRLFGDNGVPVRDADAYSVRVTVTNPEVVTVSSPEKRTVAFSGKAIGSTDFRIDVSRAGSVVFSAARLPVHVEASQ